MMTSKLYDLCVYVSENAANWEIDRPTSSLKLRNKRLESNLSVDDLLSLLSAAGKCVSRTAVYNWEDTRNPSLPDREHLWWLSKIYGCSMDSLVVEKGLPNKEEKGVLAA